MTDVACFCGCVYSFSGDSGVCPKCGQYTTLKPVDLEPERRTQRQVVLEPAHAEGRSRRPAMNKRSRKRLVDTLMQAYVTWREACLRVSDAYGSWGSGVGPDATFGFISYMAALDQEERAAEVYAGLMRGAGQLVSGEIDRVSAGSQAGSR